MRSGQDRTDPRRCPLNVAKGRQIVLALLALVFLALFGIRLLRTAVAFGLHLALVGLVLLVAVGGYLHIRRRLSKPRRTR
jgi:hypothetical protein